MGRVGVIVGNVVTIRVNVRVRVLVRIGVNVRLSVWDGGMVMVSGIRVCVSTVDIRVNVIVAVRLRVGVDETSGLRNLGREWNETLGTTEFCDFLDAPQPLNRADPLMRRYYEEGTR